MDTTRATLLKQIRDREDESAWRQFDAIYRSMLCDSPKRVEWLWQREGLKVPSRQPKRGRPWLNDGSCIRLRPEYKDHVWAYDFVHARTHDGRPLRMLAMVDEYTRECLSIDVARSMPSR